MNIPIETHAFLNSMAIVVLAWVVYAILRTNARLRRDLKDWKRSHGDDVKRLHADLLRRDNRERRKLS